MITDGTSHTLLLSEILKAWVHTDDDWRGDIYNDDGEFRFHTRYVVNVDRYTPNASQPDVLGRCQDTGDPLMPCLVQNTTAQVTAARSRHRGGVNATLCDGSVRFFADGIDPKTWSALGTMDGGDTVGDF
jgi:prepilin-type processing-associated H-X9-DG protein